MEDTEKGSLIVSCEGGRIDWGDGWKLDLSMVNGKFTLTERGLFLSLQTAGLCLHRDLPPAYVAFRVWSFLETLNKRWAI